MRILTVVALGVSIALVGCRAAQAQPDAVAPPPAPPTDPAYPSFDYFGGLRFDPAVPTPEGHLGYHVGEHFTRHGDQVAYLTRLAEASERVVMRRYGRSHQRRDLHALFVSAPGHLDRLDEILERNRELADPRTADPARVRATIESNPAIVWFSYNVHGNEPSPAECAIRLAYTMAAATNDEIATILENVVLVIDPMLNPDGHERYVSWYQNTLGARPIATPDAAEHDEPWPGGRTNHYYFDLNRDWVWLVHPESRSRLALYRQVLPQLHVDFHEQNYKQPYFFGAGDEPYHTAIPAETRDWVERYGRANATAFDREGLLYSTAERFDYLYPGYGKVLPVYHGAVGMLAEKAGHGRAGLAIEVDEHHTLTLAVRTYHHFLLSMSNLEATAALRGEQLERFHAFFDHASFSESLAPKAFVIAPHNDPALLERVWDLCAAHGIEIHALDETAEVSGLRDYRAGEDAGTRTLAAGTWIIPVAQPMGRLAAALFERETTVVDRDTYDITAWSVPVAFGLDAFYATTAIDRPTTRLEHWSPPPARITGSGDVAVIVDSAQHRFPVAAGLAATRRLVGRVADEPFEVEGVSFAAGSLIVHRVRNRDEPWRLYLEDLQGAGLNARRVATGMTESGPVLGANANRSFVAPRVLLLRGEPTSSNSYGQMWHLLDVVSPLPYTPVNADALSKVDLGAHTVLLVPDFGGDLEQTVGAAAVGRIGEWVRGGGTLVATGGAAEWASTAILGLESTATEDATPGDRPALSKLTWAERRDRGIEDRVSGAALGATVDTSHPLGRGLPGWIGVIKRSSRTLPVGAEGYVVARFDAEPRVGGVISDRNAERVGGTPLMTHHAHGRGAVICLSDDVTFRGFQHAATRLLLNALVYGPSL